MTPAQSANARYMVPMSLWFERNAASQLRDRGQRRSACSASIFVSGRLFPEDMAHGEAMAALPSSKFGHSVSRALSPRVEFRTSSLRQAVCRPDPADPARYSPRGCRELNACVDCGTQLPISAREGNVRANRPQLEDATSTSLAGSERWRESNRCRQSDHPFVLGHLIVSWRLSRRSPCRRAGGTARADASRPAAVRVSARSEIFVSSLFERGAAQLTQKNARRVSAYPHSELGPAATDCRAPGLPPDVRSRLGGNDPAVVRATF
jgi:hypothetical protein